MVDPISGCIKVYLHRILASCPLFKALCSIWGTQTCIRGTPSFPISKVNGRKEEQRALNTALQHSCHHINQFTSEAIYHKHIETYTYNPSTTFWGCSEKIIIILLLEKEEGIYRKGWEQTASPERFLGEPWL